MLVTIYYKAEDECISRQKQPLFIDRQTDNFSTANFHLIRFVFFLLYVNVFLFEMK